MTTPYAPGTQERDITKLNMALQQHAANIGSINTTISGLTSGSPFSPQGRLTLATATPVLTSNQTAKTTVYYTPYTGQFVPIYNGSAFVMTDTGGELSQATTDTTKSPAAATTNSNYDVFVWSDSGTIRATRGPAWSSGTSRGTGAGTSELQMLKGVLVNKNAITNGPGANLGTYVGTIRTNGSSQVDMRFVSVDGNSSAVNVGVWNAYNRTLLAATLYNSTATWTYSTATIRQWNATATMQFQVVSGLAEDAISVTLQTNQSSALAQGALIVGFGLDSTTAFNGGSSQYAVNATNTYFGYAWSESVLPQIGYHYIALLERGNTITCTSYGGSPGTVVAPVHTMFFRC